MDTTERSYSGAPASGPNRSEGDPTVAGSGAGGSARGTQSADVATSLAANVMDAAQSAGRAVSRQAAEVAQQVGNELGRTAEAQKQQGTDALQNLARAIDTAAGELEEQSPLVARYVRDAAHRVEDFSNHIGNRNVSELVGVATDFARSQPAIFFAGAVAAGFAFARFLKTSANGRSSSGADRSSADQPYRG